MALAAAACFPGNAQSQPVDPDHAYSALSRFMAYVHGRTSLLKGGWIFGPNVDDCYFYRIRFNDTSEYLTSSGKTPQRKRAEELGVPLLEEIPFGERRAMFTANYWGRKTALTDTSQYLCIKHFPGGDRRIENTEHITESVVYTESPAAWRDRLIPFADILHAPGALPGVMTSHAVYPALDSAARERHPDIESYFNDAYLVPATFAPHLIRGALRKDFGFEGIVVTDWVDMGAINRFLLDYGKEMPYHIATLSDEAKIIALAVHAGCNMITGIQNRQWRKNRSYEIPHVIEECARYAAKQPEWAETLRENVQHSMSYLGNEPFTVGQPSSMSVDGLSTEDMIRFVLGEPVENEEYSWMNRFLTKGFVDLWNRQSLLHLQLRALYIEASAGVDLPELGYGSENERIVTKDRNVAWVKELWGDDAFAKAYRSIDWDSRAASAAWNAALIRFMQEHGFDAEE